MHLASVRKTPGLFASALAAATLSVMAACGGGARQDLQPAFDAAALLPAPASLRGVSVIDNPQPGTSAIARHPESALKAGSLVLEPLAPTLFE